MMTMICPACLLPVDIERGKMFRVPWTMASLNFGWLFNSIQALQGPCAVRFVGEMGGKEEGILTKLTEPNVTGGKLRD